MNQFNDENQDRRKKLLDEAEEATRRGDLGESASKFMEAFDLLPNPLEINKKKMNKNTPLIEDADSSKKHAQYFFTHELPINGGQMKKAFLSMAAILILCVIGYILSEIFWDKYTYWAYSFKHRRNVLTGWPVTLSSVSLMLGIALILITPFMYFMQDWNNPSLALTNDGLFINQMMIRNTLVPFSNIERIEKVETGYKPIFKDNKSITSQQVFLFRPLLKTNLEKQMFVITSTHTAGDLDTFFAELEKKRK